ncbi:V8-like Glu-specific endopeptidase [Catenulispora sp. EB89]|uniref:trypsin-like serine peptidase n=1 Tax=Catenulispora sp. EB89 TaxID=3156257 RepID=UPI0035129AF9
MKHRRHGLLLAITALALSVSATACSGGSSGQSAEASSASSSAAAAAKVVTHVMETSPVDPHTILRPGAPGTGLIPTGAGADGTVSAQSFDGVPKVGAVFFSVGGVVSAHYCTGSVVHSASGNLIVTAGHCVYDKLFAGWQNHVVFVPGYHDDIAPYGLWAATTAYVDAGWVNKEDPDSDIAFLKVRKVGGGTQTLESVTGADTFTTSPGYENAVSVAAYPLTASKPVGCANKTKKASDTQLELDCEGLPDGASGSPFIASGDRLVGVLGGYEQGGNTPNTSYSIYFTDKIAKIYLATAGS